jgi:hypothetical protein
VRAGTKEGRGRAVVWVRAGTYYLGQPLVLTPEGSGPAASPVVYSAFPGERVTISGGRLSECRWRPYRGGIWMYDLPAVRRVWLFDRPDIKDHILSGVLLFSDGRAIRVGELPNDARSAREITFPVKTVSWVVFAVDTVSKETANVGLAEIAVFKD